MSIILEFKAGERFSKYVVLEVPKEVSDFELQGPAVIQPVDLNQTE